MLLDAVLLRCRILELNKWTMDNSASLWIEFNRLTHYQTNHQDNSAFFEPILQICNSAFVEPNLSVWIDRTNEMFNRLTQHSSVTEFIMSNLTLTWSQIHDMCACSGGVAFEMCSGSVYFLPDLRNCLCHYIWMSLLYDCLWFVAWLLDSVAWLLDSC